MWGIAPGEMAANTKSAGEEHTLAEETKTAETTMARAKKAWQDSLALASEERGWLNYMRAKEAR